MRYGTFTAVVGCALHRSKLEHLEPVGHALLERFAGFIGLLQDIVKGRNVVGHLLGDFCLGSTGERFTLTFSFLVHVPDCAALAVVGTLKSFSIREQFLLCHACQPPFVNNTTYHTLFRKSTDFFLTFCSGISGFLKAVFFVLQRKF